MALEGGAGIGNGIIKRPPQQCSVAVETAGHRADVETEEEDEGKPWIARKWISSLAVCLVALPFLAIMVSRRDRPLPLASGWTSAATARTTYAGRGRNRRADKCAALFIFLRRLVMARLILHVPCFRTNLFHGEKNLH